MLVPTTFDAACKAPLLAQLEPMLDDAARVAEVAALLQSYGIRLLYLQALKGAKIDGACFWLDEENPVIAMSLRLDRIDNFCLSCAMSWNTSSMVTDKVRKPWMIRRFCSAMTPRICRLMNSKPMRRRQISVCHRPHCRPIVRTMATKFFKLRRWRLLPVTYGGTKA